jgi:hypothetical protein
VLTNVIRGNGRHGINVQNGSVQNLIQGTSSPVTPTRQHLRRQRLSRNTFGTATPDCTQGLPGRRSLGRRLVTLRLVPS